MKLVDADVLMEQMKHRREFVGRASDPVCLVEDAPIIDAVQVRHGHWKLADIYHEDVYVCSVCHADIAVPINFDYRPTYKYCPMCGAKLDEATI